VSTSTRVRLASLSAASFVFTLAVIVESSTYCPALSPVIDVHPLVDRAKTRSNDAADAHQRVYFFLKDIANLLIGSFMNSLLQSSSE
jgi:hypothetical protein